MLRVTSHVISLVENKDLERGRGYCRVFCKLLHGSPDDVDSSLIAGVQFHENIPVYCAEQIPCKTQCGRGLSGPGWAGEKTMGHGLIFHEFFQPGDYLFLVANLSQGFWT